MQEYLKSLNPMQKEAVLTVNGPVLILAGAGSGKTRTLTSRIAYLVDYKDVSPSNILAITFTNKAAKEMRSRLENLLGEEKVSRMDVSTFHALCVKILRRNIQYLPGYNRNFSIYDDADTSTIIRRCLSALNMAEEHYTPRNMSSFISRCKNQLESPEEVAKANQGKNQDITMMCRLYKMYEERLKEDNALDFDDLLIRTLELFVEVPDCRKYYQNLYQFIHVDEYQDTNTVQYELVRLLSDGWGNICVVGDDDQSIYGWRGANIRNILDFEKDFPGAKVVRLEQNYRSRNTILKAANAVISNNSGRKVKNLWSDRGDGDLIQVYSARNERDEGNWIVAQIQDLLSNYRLGEMAILYRVNAQSRSLEEALGRAGLKYKMVGGTRFYDRKEIKDLTAYLRVLQNPLDLLSAERIINVPRRGIGEVTINALRREIQTSGRTWTQVLDDNDTLMRIVPRAAVKLRDFASMMRNLTKASTDLDLYRFVDKVAEDSGIRGSYQQDNSDEAWERLQNINEYLSAVQQFTIDNPEGTLADFLEHIALQSDLDDLDTTGEAGAVTLMTVHAAKGLEFDCVFISGLEDGLFPLTRRDSSDEQMEEERRLCYVALTRAKDYLFLSYCGKRRTYGESHRHMPSRFLREIPEALIKAHAPVQTDMERLEALRRAKKPVPRINLGGPIFTPVQKKRVLSDIQPGVKVKHPLFGTGIVIACSGVAGRRVISVAFEGSGIKNLAESIAPMEVIP
ncbi:MAG: ATP-dependent helicase [Christensenellales bacterium]|jgi:DNA helicase-2/ATP-dependent DNA helicase PcrA